MILEIDVAGSQPIYGQLRDQIVLGIASGQLKRGEPLPSVRRLAADLGINLHTVNKAYAELTDEGYVIMDRRRGAAVADASPCDETFAEELSRSLTLAAAEARCRNVSESDFIHLCRKCFADVTKRGDGNE